jgi:hypothetical protein
VVAAQAQTVASNGVATKRARQGDTTNERHQSEMLKVTNYTAKQEKHPSTQSRVHDRLWPNPPAAGGRFRAESRSKRLELTRRGYLAIVHAVDAGLNKHRSSRG